jgi:hypothetical protein
VRTLPAQLLLAVLLASGAAVARPYGGYPPPPPPFGAPGGYGRADPRQCDFYARDMAYRYAPPGVGLQGAARGAVRGGVFGAIVGGKKGAQRGAAVGGGLGAVAAGARAQRDREYAWRAAYDDCMAGFRR